MKKLMIGMIIAILLTITPVYSVEPTEETACCLFFVDGYTFHDDWECDQ